MSFEYVEKVSDTGKIDNASKPNDAVELKEEDKLNDMDKLKYTCKFNASNKLSDKGELSDATKIRDKEIIRQFITFAMKHRKIMQFYLDETGVYHAQHRLLMEISRNPNASQTDIARSMDVSTATIAVSLKKLEKGGYIKKEMDEGDNRLNQITITDKGNKVVEQSKQIFDSIDRKVFEGFTEAEKISLLALLQKLNSNLIKMEDEIKIKKERT